ncbi:MAG: hypothetical protein JWQ84_988 [Mucilaginibacter sp.]|nr:hypothetical protein [Mucilaginibacter sp.]
MKVSPGIFLYFILIVLVSCRKPYLPPAIAAPGSYLVVEGVINSGSDSTIIALSKTVNLNSKTTANPVLNAVLTVESDKGASYPLTSTGIGKYVSGGLNLDGTQKYRLRIQTTDNKTYLSDFVPVVNSPAIDSVSYAIQGNGIQMYVSSHDPKNATHYYRWDYQETWVIHSKYYSFYKSTGDTVIERNFINDEVYQCWRSDTSSTVVLGSSANLAQDVITNNPVAFVPATSEKVDGSQSIIISQFAPSTNTYSILVKQYALTGDAYRFWENLKKNTEQLGSIFDAQPSQINGNIHSLTDPSEPVIGYISAGGVTNKRIFIPNRQIPVTWLPDQSNSACVVDTLLLATIPNGSSVVVNQEDEYFNYNKGTKYYNLQIPIAGIFSKITSALIGHSGSSPQCVDCTLRGTNKQPDFWK